MSRCRTHVAHTPPASTDNGGVPQHVGREVFAVQRRAALSGEGGMFGEQPGDRVGAQWSACSGRKQWIGWAAVVFAEPDWPCSLARPLCGASPRRQLEHSVVAVVGDVDVARSVHGDTLGAIQAGERQHGRTVRPPASFSTLSLRWSAT